MNERVAEERPIYLAKWILVLFWLNLIGIVGISSIFEAGSALHTVFVWAELLLGAAVAAVFMKLGQQERAYMFAGGFHAVMVLLEALAMVLGTFGNGAVWVTAVAMLIPLVDLIAAFFEMTGHIAVMEDVEESISEGWKKLRMWYLIVVTVMQCCTYLGAVMPELAAMVAGTAAMLLVIISIFRLVSLFRTVKSLRKYGC